MGVLRDFRCAVHGVFESKEEAPLCPSGCDVVEKVFLVPPGFRSESTANTDRTVRDLASRHGMTDISNRGGRAAKRQSPQQANQQRDLGAYMEQRFGVPGPGWGNVPKGGTMNTKTHQIEGSGPGAVGAVTGLGGKPENVVEQVKDAFVPLAQKTIVRRDHQNLQVQK